MQEASHAGEGNVFCFADMPELEDTADDEVEKKKGETKEGEEHLEPKTGTAAGDTTEQVSQKAA